MPPSPSRRRRAPRPATAPGASLGADDGKPGGVDSRRNTNFKRPAPGSVDPRPQTNYDTLPPPLIVDKGDGMVKIDAMLGPTEPLGISTKPRENLRGICIAAVAHGSAAERIGAFHAGDVCFDLGLILPFLKCFPRALTAPRAWCSAIFIGC